MTINATSDSTTIRAIESDQFPFEHISVIADRESWRKEIHRPIYYIHKWWARRLGSVFRALLLGALLPATVDIKRAFYQSNRFPQSVVFDPFMGSGTTIGEALKLGARAIGRDINPVAFLQVRTAFTLSTPHELANEFRAIEADLAETIQSHYVSNLADGTECTVLYFFWVMQAPCPDCHNLMDLFSSYTFARHAYPARNPNTHVYCPNCGDIFPAHYATKDVSCLHCNYRFDPSSGPVNGRTVTCTSCQRQSNVTQLLSERRDPPMRRMYAKLVLTPQGHKLYQSITQFDRDLYQKVSDTISDSQHMIPQDILKPGHNTNQALKYGFQYWHQMFNARQLLCISMLAARIKSITDRRIRGAFTCLLSGMLEFNNMFASYKGEGTGAVRHMFYHHILKPERTPLEANPWGTPKSSGSFSTLFTNRLLRATDYAQDPFEISLASSPHGAKTERISGINEPLVGVDVSGTFDEFERGSKLYLSCGDSASTDIPNASVDIVVTDPPFFDNVHYSQLADFFFCWQKLILPESVQHRLDSTRSEAEVQNSDESLFTARLSGVLKESRRVLKDDGLLVFTYHHSRWVGWSSLLAAIGAAGFRIRACHPLKSGLSIAAPKRQAKSPINFDVAVVCRKDSSAHDQFTSTSASPLESALPRARSQVRRLRDAGFALSRNDVGVVVMAQVITELSRSKLFDSRDPKVSQFSDSIPNEIESIYQGISGPAS
jgi:adenine-specific DNA methylase